MRRADGVTYAIASNSDLAPEIADGTADFVLIGSDKVNELVLDPDPESNLPDRLRFEPLGNLACRFALFIPAVADWDKGRALTVATSYPRAFATFLGQTGIPAACTKVMSGKVERAPASGLTDAGFDIVGTGNSLRRNNLRIIQEGSQLELGGLWKGSYDDAD